MTYPITSKLSVKDGKLHMEIIHHQPAEFIVLSLGTMPSDEARALAKSFDEVVAEMEPEGEEEDE